MKEISHISPFLKSQYYFLQVAKSENQADGKVLEIELCTNRLADITSKRIGVYHATTDNRRPQQNDREAGSGRKGRKTN